MLITGGERHEVPSPLSFLALPVGFLGLEAVSAKYTIWTQSNALLVTHWNDDSLKVSHTRITSKTLLLLNSKRHPFAPRRVLSLSALSNAFFQYFNANTLSAILTPFLSPVYNPFGLIMGFSLLHIATKVQEPSPQRDSVEHDRT
jgi:hypothetical protein